MNTQSLLLWIIAHVLSFAAETSIFFFIC